MLVINSEIESTRKVRSADSKLKEKSHVEVDPAQQHGKRLPVLHDSSPIALPASPCLCSQVCMDLGFGQGRALLLYFC